MNRYEINGVEISEKIFHKVQERAIAGKSIGQNNRIKLDNGVLLDGRGDGIYTGSNGRDYASMELWKENPDGTHDVTGTVLYLDRQDAAAIIEDYTKNAKELFGACNFDGLMALPTSKVLDYYFINDPMVYMLYPDGSRVLASNKMELVKHMEKGGSFGIKESDWQRAAEPYSRNQGEYVIFQVKDGPEYRYLRFEPLEELKRCSDIIDLTCYKEVYRGRLERGEWLDDLYQKFNIDHPENYRGRSMSVSDLIMVNRNERETWYYVDSIGFADVTVDVQGKELVKWPERSESVGELRQVMDSLKAEPKSAQHRQENIMER